MGFFDSVGLGGYVPETALGDLTTGSVFDTAQNAGSGTSFDIPSFGFTPTDAVQTMAGNPDSGGSEWGGFWSGLGGTLREVARYAVQRDAVKNGVATRAPTGYTQTGRPVYSGAAVQSANLLPLLLIGGVVLLAVRR